MIFFNSRRARANCRARQATHGVHLGAVCGAHVTAHEGQKSTAATAQPVNCLVPHYF